MSFLGSLFGGWVSEDNYRPPLPPRPSRNVSERNSNESEKKGSSSPTLDLSNPDDICSRVENMQADLLHAENLCNQANKQFDTYRKQISDLIAKKKLESQRREAAEIIAKKQSREIAELKTINKKFEQELQSTTREIREAQILDAQVFEERAVRDRLVLQSYETYEATMAPELSLDEQAMLPPQPFVVMLIDGDGYRFSRELQNCVQPGVAVAQRLWLEISKYILAHPEIPGHSKIVVRIFFNGRSTLGPRVAKNMRQYSNLEEMMVQFAETQPLFDFLDCGGGKERADDKIRENAHLYISNTNCHAVFLAVCNDNGYARMLERYQANPAAQAKIILVEAGQAVREVERLAFTKIELPHVFENVTSLKRGSRLGPSLEIQQQGQIMASVSPLAILPSTEALNTTAAAAAGGQTMCHFALPQPTQKTQPRPRLFAVQSESSAMSSPQALRAAAMPLLMRLPSSMGLRVEMGSVRGRVEEMEDID